MKKSELVFLAFVAGLVTMFAVNFIKEKVQSSCNKECIQRAKDFQEDCKNSCLEHKESEPVE